MSAMIAALISCVLFWGLFLGIAAALDSRRYRKEMARILAWYDSTSLTDRIEARRLDREDGIPNGFQPWMRSYSMPREQTSEGNSRNREL